LKQAVTVDRALAAAGLARRMRFVLRSLLALVAVGLDPLHNPHNNCQEQTEYVKNKVCKQGSTCLTNDDDLANAERSTCAP
jgi:hypothetical protein